jgi:internalin A
MAPEFPIDLMVLDLRFEKGELVGSVHRIERGVSAQDQKLRVTWNVIAPPDAFFPVADGAVYVATTPETIMPPIYNAKPDTLGNGRYGWSFNTRTDLMMVLVFPEGYVPKDCAPHPERAWASDRRLVAYWRFDGETAEVQWTIRPSQLVDKEVIQINRKHARHPRRSIGALVITEPGVSKALSPRQMKSATPEWYVSYAWGDDSTPEGRARTEIVDQLCDAAVAQGHRILRDKGVLGLGDGISAFMKRIGGGDRVFVILSDKYLRSPFCMFELSEVWRTSKQQGNDFLNRVRIYALPDANISKPVDWITWAAHWKREYDELDAMARQHGAALLGEHGHRRLTQMQMFYTQVADILGTLADIVQPRTFEELKRYGFGEASLPQSSPVPVLRKS